MDTPNLRLNAFNLGWRLIWAAANPFSGLTLQASRTAQWQPEYPFGMPRWWPIGPGKLVDLDQIVLMRSVLPSMAAHSKIELSNRIPAPEVSAGQTQDVQNSPWFSLLG